MPMLEPPDESARRTFPPPRRYWRGAPPTRPEAWHSSLVVEPDALPELLTLGIRRLRGRVWKAEQEKTDAKEDHYCRRSDSADSHQIEQGRSFLRGPALTPMEQTTAGAKSSFENAHAPTATGHAGPAQEPAARRPNLPVPIATLSRGEDCYCPPERTCLSGAGPNALCRGRCAGRSGALGRPFRWACRRRP
jgi:hypothetical protein